ncbi:hypothetical protein CP533_2944 [Ophiocordyceps camponoti-saundersi (nom. inval.)]|nr:hypothetical protein CP533_2944 [Ophiocordyceps camponoti-saundersi (nom. inval.)]
MTCLCQKLLTKHYSDITKSEIIVRNTELICSQAEILKQTWTEAPQLFEVPSLSPPDIDSPTSQRRPKRQKNGTESQVRKHPRTFSTLSSNRPIPHRSRDQPLQACDSELPLSPTTVDLTLIKTPVFLAIERGDQKIETQQKIPSDLLLRGATPRRRWTVQGEIEEANALRAGLAPELITLLSDTLRLDSAFDELHLSATVSKNPDQTYTLTEAAADRIHESLCPEQLSFWRQQALTAVYRAVPWKYIESANANTNLYLSHLKHTVLAFQDCPECLPTSTRADLVLTLIEASRFSNMIWKRFAVGQAEVFVRGLQDWYLNSCIAQSHSLLSRIAGNMHQAANSLDDLTSARLSSIMDKRMHSAIGQAIIQRSLNCIQAEELSTATKLMEEWSPLDRNSSPMEETVLVRRAMMLGKIFRFQGEFTESLRHLEMARKITEQCKDLIFDEDLRNITCDLADTLRELDDPVSAEHHLRTELARRYQSCNSSPGGSLLELCLAEALFAQRRFEEAERLCLDVQSRPGLLKFEKLRLHITLAKIRHLNSESQSALVCWSEAMGAIGKFPMTNGRATRIIVMSMCDILGSLGHNWLLDESLRQVASLDEMEKPGGIQYWIAGLRHWLEYLQSRGVQSRM